MLNVTNGQALIFLLFFLFGIALSLVYLIFYNIIKKTNLPALLFIFDFFYSIIIFGLFFILLLNLNYGELRLYIPLAVLLGAFLAHKISSIIVAKKLKKRYTTKEIKKE